MHQVARFDSVERLFCAAVLYTASLCYNHLLKYLQCNLDASLYTDCMANHTLHIMHTMQIMA